MTYNNQEYFKQAKEYLADFLCEAADNGISAEEINEALDEVVAEMLKYLEAQADVYRAVARRSVSKA